MGPPAINNTPAGVRFPLTKLPDLPLLSASQLPEPPSPAPALWPNWRVVCISGEQILPLAWEFNGCPFQRLRIAVTHLQEVGVKLWEFLSAQLESSNQPSLGLALRIQPLSGFFRSHLTLVYGPLEQKRESVISLKCTVFGWPILWNLRINLFLRCLWPH